MNGFIQDDGFENIVVRITEDKRDSSKFLTPLLTPASVYELQNIVVQKKRIGENPNTRIFLVHLEKSFIVRGIYQELGSEVCLEDDLNYVDEFPIVRRPDSGKSWYHFRTVCVMEGTVRDESRGFKSFSKRLIDLIGSLNIDFETKLYRLRESDIYNVEARKQLVGLSSLSRMPISGFLLPELEMDIFRGCMYTEQKTSEHLRDMIVADIGEENVDAVLNNIEILPSGFLSRIYDRYGFGVDARDFITLDSYSKAVNLQSYIPPEEISKKFRGPCVTPLNVK